MIFGALSIFGSISMKDSDVCVLSISVYWSVPAVAAKQDGSVFKWVLRSICGYCTVVYTCDILSNRSIMMEVSWLLISSTLECSINIEI